VTRVAEPVGEEEARRYKCEIADIAGAVLIFPFVEALSTRVTANDPTSEPNIAVLQTQGGDVEGGRYQVAVPLGFLAIAGT
jgi:hypothetical protein